MNKNKSVRFAACVAFALAASATLPAAELTHRWSFNGDWSDSAGGTDAVKCGTYVSLYGGRVHMGYGACSHGTGYVDLGTMGARGQSPVTPVQMYSLDLRKKVRSCQV